MVGRTGGVVQFARRVINEWQIAAFVTASTIKMRSHNDTAFAHSEIAAVLKFKFLETQERTNNHIWIQFIHPNPCRGNFFAT